MEEYYYPENGEQLGKYQPYLEFKLENGDWVESAVISSLMRESFAGLYRVNKKFLQKEDNL